jgi:hypothetical protein
VDQQVHLAGSCGSFDPIRAVEQVAGARFHAEAVERRLAEGRLQTLTQVGFNRKSVRLEGTLQRALQLALCIGVVELVARDADPRAATWSPRTDIRVHASIGSEREPDQLVPVSLAPRENARPLRDARFLNRAVGT